MTIFVDILTNYPKNAINPKARRYGVSWCHMWCDGDEEKLHDMADKIGLKRAYFQKHRVVSHYDLIPSKRRRAIEFGAIEMSYKTWLMEKMNGGSKGG